MRLAIMAAAILLLAAACGGSGAGEQRLTVFAAASLTDAFQEAGRAFEQAHPGVTVTMHFAATPTLRTQLEQGARADLFASADQQQMALARKAAVVEGEPVLFAANRLAIVVRAGDSKVSRLEDLAQPGLRLILGAPQVPIGAYTEAAFERIAADLRYGPDFVRRMRANVVSQGLNARHAISTVQLGEADAAIAYVTDAGQGGGSPLRAIPLPTELAGVALYPIAVGKGTAQGSLARAFIAFLRSEEGLRILERHGFGRS